MLDAMVAPQLADAPDRLAQWRTLSRFVRVAQPDLASPDQVRPEPAPAVVPNGVSNVVPTEESREPLDRAA